MANAWDNFGAPDEAPSWESFGAPEASTRLPSTAYPKVDQNDPLAAASAGLPVYVNQNPAPEGPPPSDWGIDPAAKEFISGGHTFTPRGILANAIDYGVVPFQAIGKGIEKGAEGLDYLARESGLADLPETLGLHKLTGVKEQLLPGAGIMAALEAFPLGGIEAGIPYSGPTLAQARPLTKFNAEGAQPFRLAPEVEAGLEQMYKSGTAEDILNYAKQNNFDLDTQGILNFVKERDKGGPVNTKVTYDQPQAFDYGTQGELPIAETQLPLKFNEQPKRLNELPPQRGEIADEYNSGFHGEEQGSLFDNHNPQGELFSPEETPFQTKTSKGEAPVQEQQGLSPAQEEHISSVNKAWEDTTGEWQGRPDVEIVHDASHIEDAGVRADFENNPNSTALIGPDGKVRILASRVQPGDIEGIAFHEALGHNGLSKVFGDSLDSTLEGIYNSTPWFKDKVDQWIKKNPNSYVDASNKTARAADEVFAEMSENGGPIERGMARRIYDQVANTVKDFGRQMGLKLEYSKREVDSILGMAHEAVINGKSVADNGFFSGSRFKQTPEARRAAIKQASADLAETKPGETKTVRPFPEDEPDYHRFLHVTPEGKKVSGTYTLENGTLDNFSINTEGGPRAIGPKSIRQIGRDLMKEHPEAKNITGYRISGARPTEEIVSSGSRFKDSGTKKSLSPEGYKTFGDIDDELAFLGKEAEREGTGASSYTNREIERMADDLGLNASRYLKSQGFEQKRLAAKIVGAKQVMANQLEDMIRLRERIKTEGMTPSNLNDLAEKLATAKAVYARFDNDTAELGRALQTLKGVSESRKMGKEMARFMEGGADMPALLKDPEAVTRFLDNLDKGDIKGMKQQIKGLDKSDWQADLLGLPRTLMASADLSAPFRQGIFLSSRGEFWKGIPTMIKAMASKKTGDFIAESIQSRPTYDMMEKAGLAVAEHISGREESFPSQLVKKVPVIRGSERAYSTFLHKLRADVFDSFVRSYEKAGIEIDPAKAKEIARYINTATGKGHFESKAMNSAVPALNAAFFSPRLMKSRYDLLTKYLSPEQIYKMDPVMRRQVIRDFVGFAGVTASALGLAKLIFGDKVTIENDPRSSDFLKIKKGNTTYDLGGGFNQYLTLASRITSGTHKLANGDIKEYGKAFGDPTRKDALVDFLSNKESPILSYFDQALKGKTPSGETFNPATEAGKRLIPIIAQDIYGAYQNGDMSDAVTTGIASGLGIGVQSYDRPEQRKFDAYGQEINPEEIRGTRPEASSEGISEVQRLEDASGKDIGSFVGKSVTVNGEKRDLSKEEYDSYQQQAGSYFKQVMDQVVNDPEYQGLSDEDKLKYVRQIRDEIRKEVRDDMFKGE